MMTNPNKTFRPKKNDITRNWYHIDVKGRTLGKVATGIANLLRGKNKPYFVPNLDCGDFVVITNMDGIVLTGKKETQKLYRTHSTYQGHMKAVTPAELRAKGQTEKILIEAVKGMIPANKLRDDIMRKLKIFAGETHTHEAQKPVTITL